MQILALLRGDDPGFALEQQLYSRLIGDGLAEELATRCAIGARRSPETFELPDQQADQLARDRRDACLPEWLVGFCRGLFRMGKLRGRPGWPTLMAIVQEDGLTQGQGVDPASRRMAFVSILWRCCLVEVHLALALIQTGKRRRQLLIQ
ncbi:hypothetical protein D3C87_1087540 [compost metagenome]